jgi:glutathione S-transferase
VEAVRASGFLFGSTPSIADAAVVGQLFMVEVALPGWVRAHVPTLVGWFEHLSA